MPSLFNLPTVDGSGGGLNGAQISVDSPTTNQLQSAKNAANLGIQAQQEAEAAKPTGLAKISSDVLSFAGTAASALEKSAVKAVGIAGTLLQDSKYLTPGVPSLLNSKVGTALGNWAASKSQQLSTPSDNLLGFAQSTSPTATKVGGFVGNIGAQSVNAALDVSTGGAYGIAYLLGDAQNILKDPKQNDYQKVGSFLGDAAQFIPGLTDVVKGSDAIEGNTAASILNDLGGDTTTDARASIEKSITSPVKVSLTKAFNGAMANIAGFGTAQAASQILLADQQGTTQGLTPSEQGGWVSYLKSIGEAYGSAAAFTLGFGAISAVTGSFGTVHDNAVTEKVAAQIRDASNKFIPIDSETSDAATLADRKTFYQESAKNMMNNLSENQKALLAYKIDNLFRSDTGTIQEISDNHITNTVLNKVVKASDTYFNTGTTPASLYDAQIGRVENTKIGGQPVRVDLTDEKLPDNGVPKGAKTSFDTKTGQYVVTVNKDNTPDFYNEIGHIAQLKIDDEHGDGTTEAIFRAGKDEITKAREIIPGAKEKNESGGFTMPAKEVVAEIIGKHYREMFIPANGAPLDPHALVQFENDYPKLSAFLEAGLGNIQNVADINNRSGLAFGEGVKDIRKQAGDTTATETPKSKSGTPPENTSQAPQGGQPTSTINPTENPTQSQVDKSTPQKSDFSFDTFKNERNVITSSKRGDIKVQFSNSLDAALNVISKAGKSTEKLASDVASYLGISKEDAVTLAEKVRTTIPDLIPKDEWKDGVTVPDLSSFISKQVEKMGGKMPEDAATDIKTIPKKLFSAPIPVAKPTPETASEAPQATTQVQSTPTDTANQTENTAPAQVKMMITNNDRVALGKLGYSPEDIKTMKPQEAGDIISSNTQKGQAPQTTTAPPQTAPTPNQGQGQKTQNDASSAFQQQYDEGRFNHTSQPDVTPSGTAKTDEIRSSDQYLKELNRLAPNKMNIEQSRTEIDTLISTGKITKDTYLNSDVGQSLPLMSQPQTQYATARLIAEGYGKVSDLRANGDMVAADKEWDDVVKLHVIRSVGGTVAGQTLRMAQEGVNIPLFSQASAEVLNSLDPKDPNYSGKVDQLLAKESITRQVLRKFVRPIGSAIMTPVGIARVTMENLSQGSINTAKGMLDNLLSGGDWGDILKYTTNSVKSISKDAEDAKGLFKSDKTEALTAYTRLAYQANDKATLSLGAASQVVSEVHAAQKEGYSFTDEEIQKMVNDRVQQAAGQGKLVGGTSKGIGNFLKQSTSDTPLGNLMYLFTRGGRAILNLTGNRVEDIPVLGMLRMSAITKEEYGVSYGDAWNHLLGKEAPTDEKGEPVYDGKKLAMASARVRQNLIGQAIVGTALTGLYGVFIDSSDNTKNRPTIIGNGPSDPNERNTLEAQGVQFNSFRIPGTDAYIPFSNLGPFAPVFEAVAGVQDAKNYSTGSDANTIGVALESAAGSLFNSVYLQNLTGTQTNPLQTLHDAVVGQDYQKANAWSSIFTPLTGIARPVSQTVGLFQGNDKKKSSKATGGLSDVMSGLQQSLINTGWFDTPALKQASEAIFGKMDTVTGPEGEPLKVTKIPGLQWSTDNENPVYRAMTNAGKTIGIPSFSYLSGSSNNISYSVSLSPDQRNAYLNSFGKYYQMSALQTITDPSFTQATSQEQASLLGEVETTARSQAKNDLYILYPGLSGQVNTAIKKSTDDYYGTGQ